MTHVIRVGNSLGVRIPKAITMQLGLTENTDIELKITDNGLLISPVRHRREGWADSFKLLHKKNKKSCKKEPLLMGDNISNEFDKDEWEW